MDALEFASISIKKAPLRFFAWLLLSLVSCCGVPLMAAYWREWSIQQGVWYQAFCVIFPIVMGLFVNLSYVVYKYKKNQRGE